MKYKTALIPVFLMFFAVTSVLTAADINVSIRYRDMKIYYLDSDPIWIEITLTNRGPDPYRFKLADERAFSLDFDVRTTTNRPVEISDLLMRKRSQSQSVYFREVLVEAGESFSFYENLRDYNFIANSGAYIVQARIYPELYKPEYYSSLAVMQQSALLSNRLSLNIRFPPIPGPDGVVAALDVQTNAVLVREKIPPDEVVSYLLTARQKEQWEKFFLYMDLESMLNRDSYRKRQWAAESEEGRQMMIDRYRTELQSAVIDGDISTIPLDFTIERTVYNADEGTVSVLEYFKAGNYTEKKRYTYYLKREDGIWNIVDYTVINLGTE